MIFEEVHFGEDCCCWESLPIEGHNGSYVFFCGETNKTDTYMYTYVATYIATCSISIVVALSKKAYGRFKA